MQNNNNEKWTELNWNEVKSNEIKLQWEKMKKKKMQQRFCIALHRIVDAYVYEQ